MGRLGVSLACAAVLLGTAVLCIRVVEDNMPDMSDEELRARIPKFEMKLSSEEEEVLQDHLKKTASVVEESEQEWDVVRKAADSVTNVFKTVAQDLRFDVFQRLFSRDRLFSALMRKFFERVYLSYPRVPSQDGSVSYNVQLNRNGIYCEGRGADETIVVAHGTEFKTIPYLSQCSTYRDILDEAKSAFSDYQLRHLWTREGQPIELDQAVLQPHEGDYESRYIQVTRAMRSNLFYQGEERFYYSADRVGDRLEIPFRVGGTYRYANLTAVSLDPKIFVLDDFLTPEECKEAIEFTHNLPADKQLDWVKSSIGIDEESGNIDTQQRVSSTLWLGRLHKTSNDFIDMLHERGRAILKAPLELSEPFQVVHYPPGGHYSFHTDASDIRYAGNNKYFAGGGNRYVTMLIYLSKPTGGGHTSFPMVTNPKLKDTELRKNPKTYCSPEYFHVEAKAGRAVIFYDLDEKYHMDGVVDPKTEHAGCPTEGEEEKYIMNLWVRNKRVPVGNKWNLYDNNW